jgi:hypothetical protein
MISQIIEEVRTELKMYRAAFRQEAIRNLKNAPHPRISSLLMGVWQRGVSHWPWVTPEKHLSELQKQQRLVLNKLPDTEKLQ